MKHQLIAPHDRRRVAFHAARLDGVLVPPRFFTGAAVEREEVAKVIPVHGEDYRLQAPGLGSQGEGLVGIFPDLAFLLVAGAALIAYALRAIEARA